jgi:hypothetical protein
MAEILQTLAGAPIATILVFAGILFLIMSVADKVSDHLTIPETRKKQALVLGVVLLFGGIALSFQSMPKSPEAGAVALPSGTAAQAVDWDAVSWDGMTPEQRALWSELGWTKESWSDEAPAPPTEGKAFADLSTAEQEAARGLGFSPDLWDLRD